MKAPFTGRVAKAALLGGTIFTSALAAPAMAQDGASAAQDENTIIVTATRRAESVQDIPLNIAAVGTEQIEEQGLTELSDLLPFVPGINVVDRGGRQGNPIIVRGLNVEAIGSGDGDNDGGGTVATYLGEIPVFVDLKLNDLERVEVLLGPQGTLYGAGTLGGAIRYIPVKPQFNEFSGQVRAELSKYSEASSLSHETGFTVNIGVSDTFAIRGSLDWSDDSGFIDYVGVVDEIGVTNGDTAEGLNRVKDADGEETISGRIAARWQPTPALDATLTYYYQEADIEGRRVSHWRDNVPGLLDGTPSVGRYENAQRVVEPNEIKNDLLALEVVADLGFAELTSATGWSNFADEGQRDQSPLLITLEYSYELFPGFTAFTFEEGEEERINQEVRLVSKHGGPFSWIVGGYYNKLTLAASSSEFTPNFVEFVNQPGLDFGYTNRPDDLEYFSADRQRLVEVAAFGELSYTLFDRLTLTAGARYYDYDLKAFASVDFPHFEDISYMPLTLDEIANAAFDPDLSQSDNGFLYKFNASYEASDDLLVYATVSEGYRIGATNGLGQCDSFDPNATQGSCALAPGQQFDDNPDQFSTRDERQYFPDKTRNYEIGFKSTLANGALTFNGAAYYIDWIDPQLGSATVNASIPITVNGEGAEAKGIELSANWRATDRLRLRGNFSYIDAELTDFTPGLIQAIDPPGFGTVFEDGEEGDRLPGTPKTQFSVFGSYDHPLANGDGLIFNASYSYQSSVLTRAGGRGGSLTLDGYGTANAAVTYEADRWSATLFADNLFDKFAETGAANTPLFSQTVQDFNGDPVYPRRFFTNILPPRQIGVRFKINFGG
ncbi:TonB-dependent receptor [Altererythrobacter sp. MF3-039]|uniref:TonB-dependent receptor n=1 Tax=Altererythrobacter sp. MF3-039 TaxID=3252901 RepID=UPI00390CC1DF